MILSLDLRGAVRLRLAEKSGPSRAVVNLPQATWPVEASPWGKRATFSS